MMVSASYSIGNGFEAAHAYLLYISTSILCMLVITYLAFYVIMYSINCLQLFNSKDRMIFNRAWRMTTSEILALSKSSI